MFTKVLGAACLVVVALGAMCPSYADPAPAPTWVAFHSVDGAFTGGENPPLDAAALSCVALPANYHFISPEAAFMNMAPQFIVYSDGTAIWHSVSAARANGSEDPAQWQTGMVDPAKLAKFRLQIEPSAFFTIPEPKADGAAPGVPSDPATTRVGAQFGAKHRVIAIYDLADAEDARPRKPIVTTLMAVRQSLWALKPAESQALVPPKILVGLFIASQQPGSATWPVAKLPSTTTTTTYSGADAATIIAALDKQGIYTVGGKHYHAVWVPVVDFPGPPVPVKTQ